MRPFERVLLWVLLASNLYMFATSVTRDEISDIAADEIQDARLVTQDDLDDYPTTDAVQEVVDEIVARLD